jgi:conjugal transfer mating pair stabilization protein TraG
VGRRKPTIKKAWARLKKTWRVLRRRKNRPLVMGGLAVIVVAMLGYILLRPVPTHIDPTAYTPLLNTIADGESKGNYNAYYGHGDNTDIRFTDMTVAQVLFWQKQYVASGSPSSAVGRYQIIRPTLLGLVKQLNLDMSSKFDAHLQDQLAITLMERRGSVDYVEKKLSATQFAANLAKEWASLPRMTGPDPAASYYSGDGLNEARVSIPAVNSALSKLSAPAN